MNKKRNTTVRKEEVRSMLAQFKTFVEDRCDLDELVGLSAYGKTLRAEYEHLQVEVPAYVGQQLNALTRAIKGRIADSVESRRKQIDSQLESLRTPAEKRSALEAEKAKLDNHPLASV